MDCRPNKTYFDMLRIYKEHKRPDNCLHIFNEGGSRSGKTFDTFDLIADFCMVSRRPMEIYVFRSSLIDCKDYTYNDFKNKMKLRGLYSPSNAFAENSRPDYRLNGSTIMFRGLDKLDENEGFTSDIVFINEMLSGVSELQFENVTMRCRMLVIGDWNPKYTTHWVFNREGRPNTFFTHSTFRDNPHCPPAVRDKILSYEPTAANIEAGTADDYRWKVYGLGHRAAQEGIIFPRINWIGEFPQDLEHVIFGMDFGFTNDPTVLIRAGVRDNNLYFEELFRAPVVDANILYDCIAPFFSPNDYCYGDSADKYATNATGQINALRTRGLNIIPVKKYHGSIVDGISIMKNFDLNIVENPAVRNEANAYVWDTVHGIAINKPRDENNHFWDAARYTVISELKRYYV